MTSSVEQIEIPTASLPAVLEKLAEKRVAVEKEVLNFGEAPAGIKEVFELCRGFERAFGNIINETATARKIKDVFMGDKGLSGNVRKLPLDKIFELANVKLVCRQADGYQPHLVSPERGLRQLASEALDLVTTPVKSCVAEVYQLLIASAREAAEKAGQFTESALMGSMPMYIPEFKNVVMPAIITAMDDWREESIKMALMLVDMERSYITAGYFRHTMHHRTQKILAQQALQKAAQSHVAQQPERKNNFLPSFGNKREDPRALGAPGPGAPGPGANAVEDDDSDDEVPGSSAPSVAGAPRVGGTMNMTQFQNQSDYIAAYFDKFASNDSTRQALPDAWRWQRRFFVYHDNLKMLYYFKTPDDVPKPNGLRGQVMLGDCVVEDLDSNAQPRTSAPPPGDTKPNILIRIRHRDPRGTIVKNHNVIVLRAESTQQKLEWLARFRSSLVAKKPEPRKGQAATTGGGGGGAASAASGADLSSGGAPPGGPQGPPGPAGIMDDFDGDLSWAKDAEPVVDSHLGEGSAAFRAENVRSADGMLLPAPSILLSPLFLADKLKKLASSPQAQYEARYDALLEQFAHDMSTYTKMVCDTVSITTPKAIVHCMVKKSEKNLLERLFNVIHHLTPMQLEGLLKEDPDVVLRRNASRRCLEDVKTGIFQIQQLLERQNMAGGAEKRDKHTLNAELFALSGQLEYLSPESRAKWSAKFNDPYFPAVMKFPPVAPPRSATPPPQKPQPMASMGPNRSAIAPSAASMTSQGAQPPPMRASGPLPSGGVGGAPQAMLPRPNLPQGAMGAPMRGPTGGVEISRPSVDGRKAPPPPANGVPMVTRRPPPPPPGK